MTEQSPRVAKELPVIFLRGREAYVRSDINIGKVRGARYGRTSRPASFALRGTHVGSKMIVNGPGGIQSRMETARAESSIGRVHRLSVS